MALSLEEYLRTHRETIRPWVLVKQLKQYQEQHAENHALLGDRLLYVYLYKMAKLLDKGSDVTGGVTHLQSEIFSDRSLASFGNDIFEHLLEREEWNKLSDKERGTFVEATVGACFHMEGLQFSEQFDVIIGSIVNRLYEAAQSRPTGDPIRLVHEWLQKQRIIDPHSRFQTIETGVQSFQTTIDFGLSGESRLQTGPVCQSKDVARRLAAELVVADLGLGEVAPSEVRRVGPPAPAETGADLVRDETFNQTLERERWDLEQTLEWFSQKSKKKPYAAPFLLRAQLDNAFEIVGWAGNLDKEFVAVMTAAFSGERYWSFGISKISRSKSKDAAGEELLKHVPFVDWIRRILASPKSVLRPPDESA